MLLALCVCWLSVAAADSSLTKQIQKVDTCTSQQYYDTSSLSCKECSNSTNHKTPDLTAADGNGNSLGCVCEIGYVKVVKDCSQVSFSFHDQRVTHERRTRPGTVSISNVLCV
jgi:hypothetical protein